MAVMPQPTAADVFGIARTTATSSRLPPVAAASCCSTKPVGTEAATETSSVCGPISVAISCNTSTTVWGFTVSRMMSAPLTVSRLSVVTAMPNSFASAAALSACLTVAVTRADTKSLCFKYARSRMPPNLPAPSTTSFLSESVSDMVNALPNNERLTRSSPDSLAATLAAQPSMSLVPLAPFLHSGRNDKMSAPVHFRELTPDLAFTLRQFLRNIYLHDDIEIAAFAGNARQAVFAQSKSLPALRAARNFQANISFERRHFQFRPERRLLGSNLHFVN